MRLDTRPHWWTEANGAKLLQGPPKTPPLPSSTGRSTSYFLIVDGELSLRAFRHQLLSLAAIRGHGRLSARRQVLGQRMVELRDWLKSPFEKIAPIQVSKDQAPWRMLVMLRRR